MTVNMLSIVCVFHSFFTFFFIEGALAFRLFCVSCHFIHRFSSFSLLKSTQFSTLVFFFLYVLVKRLFPFMNVRLSWFVRVSIHLLLFFVLLFWSICENFQLLQSFNSREDLNSCFLKTRGREICSFTHFELCSPPFSVVVHYYLFSCCYHFWRFCFFVFFVRSGFALSYKPLTSLNSLVFHRSVCICFIDFFLLVVNGNIVTSIPLSFFL